jgi:hypothetical protein
VPGNRQTPHWYAVRWFWLTPLRFACSERSRAKVFHGGNTRNRAARRGREKGAIPDPNDQEPGWRSSRHAEDRGMHGRFEIQSDDVGSLLLKLRIITGHVAARTVGLKSKLPPHPTHGRLTEAKLLSQSITAPMGRAIVGPTPGQFQNARFGLSGSSSILGATIT